MLEVRKAGVEDMPRVLELIHELARFEKEPEQVKLTIKELEEGLTSEPCAFICFVGLINSSIEGMALCYPRFSTWAGQTIHLEDLIVSEKHRKKGLGKMLYNRVLRHAQDRGVRRVEWVVLEWNKNAIDFYERTGAVMIKDWHLAQMDDKTLALYLENEDI
jgi:GNAT superfamily N-acetyltransferase